MFWKKKTSVQVISYPSFTITVHDFVVTYCLHCYNIEVSLPFPGQRLQICQRYSLVETPWFALLMTGK